MISSDTIQQIFDAIRIEEVVGDFVNLKKSGKSYKGFSPFTDETNPSFFVSPTKNIFKCFSSGVGGNAVKFLMEHEHFTYPEALRYLAKKYNIEIEEKERSPEEIQEMNERETLFHINSFAVKFFEDQLHETEEGKAIGLSYLKERGYQLDTIKKFQVGYSPDAWEAFTQHALKNGYKLEYLVKLGLTIEKDDKKTYDRFRSRVLFPIHNLSGRILGFGGRIMVSDDKKPKYVNSPESEIYNKSQNLYGIYYSKSSIIRNDLCYLVEGYTDLISLFQAGIENVVSSSGTSLTIEQIRLIKRYTPNITILYDGDAAGIKASFRGIDLILEQGMNVKIILFPEGTDPDSFAQNNTTSDLVAFINDNANDFIKFKTNLLKEEAANDPVKKAGLIKEIIESIAIIPDSIFRTIYVKECSSILDIPEQTLINELNRILRKKFRIKQEGIQKEYIQERTEYKPPRQTETNDTHSEFQERNIIRLILNYGNNDILFEELDEHKKKIEVPVKVAQFIVSDLQEDDIRFANPIYQKIFDEYSKAIEKEHIPSEQHFINHEDPEVSRITIDMLSSQYELSKNWDKVRIHVPTEEERLKKNVETSLLALKDKEVKKEILTNQKRLKETNEKNEMTLLLEEQKELKAVSREINAKLSRIITR